MCVCVCVCVCAEMKIARMVLFLSYLPRLNILGFKI